MSTGAIEAGRAFVRIFAKDDTKKELAKIGARFKSWGASIAVVGGAMSAASAGVMAGLSAAVGEFSKIGSDLTDMSGRTGVAASALSELGFVAGQSGASMADLEIAMKTMTRKTGKSGEAAFLSYADAISKIEDPGKRAQAAMEVFGKSGTKLLPMLAGGAAEIQKMREQARLMGITLTDEDAASADKLGDSLAMLSSTFKGIALQVGAAIAPLVQFAVDALQPVVTAVVRIVKENRGLVQAFAVGAAVVGALGAVLLTLGGTLAVVGGVIAALPAIVAGLATAFSAAGAVLAAVFSPIGILVAGIAAAMVALSAGIAYLVYWFMTATTAGKAFATSLGLMWSAAKATFKGIGDALSAGRLDLAMKVVMSSLTAIWTVGVNGLRIAWGNMTSYIVTSLVSAVQKAASVMSGFIQAQAAAVSMVLNQAGLKGIDASGAANVLGAVGSTAGGMGQAFKDSNNAKLAKLNEESRKAYEAWQATLKEAADAKTAVEKKAKLPDVKMTDIADTIKAGAVGTFSGFAAGLLGQAGGSALEKEAKKHTELLKGIDGKLGDMEGLAFE